MSVLTPVRLTFLSRCLVYWRAQPEVIAGLLPAGLSPSVFREHCLVGLCWTRYLGIPGRFLPRGMTPAWDELAYCFPIERGEREARDDERGFAHGVWVVRRETSSRFSAHWASRVLGGEYELAEFRVHETPAALELEVLAHGERELALSAESATELVGSVFLSAREVEEYLRQSGAIEPRNPLVPEAPELSVSGGHWAVDPLAVFRLSCPFFEDEQRFPKGTLQPDSAFRLVNVGPARASEPFALGELSLGGTAPST